MKFPFKCNDCGHLNQFEWSQVGQTGECSRCGKLLTVPAPMETTSDAPPPPARVKFRCPACRRKFATKAEMAGQKIRCTGCGAGVRVPLPDGAVAMPSSQPGVFEFALSDELEIAPEPPRSKVARADARSRGSAGANAGAEASVQAQAGPRAHASPNSVAAAVTPRIDVRQVDTTPTDNKNAGPGLSAAELEALVGLSGAQPRLRAETSLSPRSALVESVRQQAALAEAEAPTKTTKSGKKKKKKKKKHSSFFDPKETLKLVAGVGVVVGVIALLAWGYPELRLPLGGFLCVIGFIVYVLGAVSLRQLVAEEGFIKLLLFRFCPPYQWWFVATRWQDTKDFFAFFLAGAMVISLGSAIIKTSPLSIKAEAAELAHKKKVERKRAEVQAPVINTIVEADDED